MDQIFLALIFIINGEFSILDGYNPRLQPDMETCMDRGEYLRDYVNSLDMNYKFHGVLCGTEKDIQALIYTLPYSQI